MNRRQFLASSVATLAVSSALVHAQPSNKAKRRFEFCAFEKPLQFLSYEELADLIAELGYDGIEATVRPNGHVLPERVTQDLPRLHKALGQRGLKINVLTSGISSPDSAYAETVLKTAKDLGITQYRTDWYRYDLKRPIMPQLEAHGRTLRALAAFNEKLGMTGLYQNHSGAQFVGAPLWDLYQIIKDIDPKHVGLAFDIRHATVEGGLSWPVQFHLVRPHIGAVFLKDFVWENNKVKSVPLGTGMVDHKYFSLLKESGFTGPVSIHVEYFPSRSTDKTAIAEALRADLQKAKQLLA